MSIYVCSVCGYISDSDEPPTKCPLCGVPADMFEPEEDDE